MISENLAVIKDAIRKVCIRCGRKPEEVLLIAVSKNFPPASIELAIGAGQFHFGENRAQEFQAKKAVLPDSLHWHFIGHLQTNKADIVTGAAEFIHSVDRMKLLRVIEERAAKLGIVQKIFIEMKTAPEDTKSGAKSVDEVKELIYMAKESEFLAPVGLMTIGPLEGDESTIRESFRTLKRVQGEMANEGIELPELSMGMSGDFEIAIEEGATMVRIGSAIFGQRNYSAV